MIILEEVFEPFFLFLALATLGDIVIERSGVLNLGIDGFIVFSIALCYTVTMIYGAVIALVIIIIFAILYASIISLFINFLHSSHILTGLVLNMIFYGLSAVVGNRGLSYALSIGKATLTSPIYIEWQYILVLTIFVTIAIWIFLYKTRLGVAIRACGFNPRAADYLGIRVWVIRWCSLVIGYIVISLGVYVFMLLYAKTWFTYRGMGYGFLILALAMASLWSPLVAIMPITIFSYLEKSQFIYQLEYGISQYILSMFPYVFAILFVVIVNISPLGRKLTIPKALGEVYFKEERAA